MALAKNKTVRFAQVVERSGQPQVHTLWVTPAQDPALQQALRAHRVMTIAPGPGGKTDVGRVGFDTRGANGARRQFLIFPKSLERFEGARVVGIKFDLVAQPKRVAPGKSAILRLPPATSPRPAPASRRAPARPPHAAPPSVVPFPAPPRPTPSPTATRQTRAQARDEALTQALLAALEDLDQGRSAAARRRLARALAKK